MILKGDCIEVMKAMKPNSVDAIVTDPPYGLEFMGKEWDKLRNTWQAEKGRYHNDTTFIAKGDRVRYQAGLEMQLWHTQWLTEAYRVLKPGGSMLVMGGTRTFHRLACAIEDSGFIIKDTLMWIIGSGFPKAQDFSKATLKKFLREWLEDVDRFHYKDGDFQFDCPYNCHLCDELFQFFQVGDQDSKHKQGDAQEHSHLSEPLAKALSDILHKRKASYASLFFRPAKQGYQLHIISSDGQLSQEEFSDLCQLYSEQLKKNESGDAIPQAYKDLSNIDILSCEFVLEKFEKYCHNYDISQLPSYKHCNRINQFIQAKLLKGMKVGGIKPAYEPIIWAVKPPEGSYVDNVLKHGVGAVNVDECRVGVESDDNNKRKATGKMGGSDSCFGVGNKYRPETLSKGRFPANVILDEEAGKMLDEQSGNLSSGKPAGIKAGGKLNCYGVFAGGIPVTGIGDSGGASRFFYCAKASRSERNAGLEGMEEKVKQENLLNSQFRTDERSKKGGYDNKKEIITKNNHPTVKPIKLFEYLIKLVTREGQIVLDPFIGSGTTAIASHNTGRKCVGIEKEDEYLTIAKRRIDYWQNQPQQLALGDKNVSI